MTVHDAVMMFQFFQLTLLGFITFIAFATPVAPLTNKPKIPNNGRIGKISQRFATGNIHFFVSFFFFIFKPIPIFVLTFSPRVESFTVIYPALSISAPPQRVFCQLRVTAICQLFS